MNRYEKQIEALSLKDEKEVLNELSRQYKEAMGNIKEKVAELEKRLGDTTDESIRRSITYQLNYQKALQGQIGGILDNLQSNNFNTIQDFLKKSYETGFIGSIYDIQGQGIPLILPIDQNKMIKAIMTDSKIKEDLYTSLGNNIKDLKNEIRREITRGLANNYSYSQIAQLIDIRGDVSKNKAYRIARTEGHRVQQEATYDAQVQAKKEGADVVKQWVAITDNRTREAHAELDGKIVEVEKPFEYGGHKALYPGGFGVAGLDINCRCRIVQRAKWALDEEELARLEERAKKFDLDKTKDFEDFKKKYLNAVEEVNYDEAYSGNQALSERVKKRIEKTEQLNIGSQNEHVTIYDKDGNVIFENSGTANRVFVEDDKLKDAILTHNHPNAGYLSRADVANHIEGGSFQTRATTIEGNVFSVTTIDKSKLDGIDIEQFKKDFDNAYWKRPKQAGSTASIKVDSEEFAQYMNDTIGKKYGLKFDVEKSYERIDYFIEPEEMAKKLNISLDDDVIEKPNYKLINDEDEAKDFFAKSERDWLDNISSDAKDTIHYYSETGSSKINGLLRGDTSYKSWDGLDKVVNDMDKAISRFDLKEDIVTYRAVDSSLMEDIIDNLKVGDVFTDKAYMSTSPVYDAVRAFANDYECDVMFEMHVKKGKGKGAYVNELSLFKDEEFEFLLSRDSKFSVKSIEQKNGFTYIVMEEK